MTLKFGAQYQEMENYWNEYQFVTVPTFIPQAHISQISRISERISQEKFEITVYCD